METWSCVSFSFSSFPHVVAFFCYSPQMAIVSTSSQNELNTDYISLYLVIDILFDVQLCQWMLIISSCYVLWLKCLCCTARHLEMAPIVSAICVNCTLQWNNVILLLTMKVFIINILALLLVTRMSHEHHIYSLNVNQWLKMQMEMFEFWSCDVFIGTTISCNRVFFSVSVISLTETVKQIIKYHTLS